MKKIIEDKNILTLEEKNHIENYILGSEFPFYWNDDQVQPDNLPFFGHTLKHRETKNINSYEYYFFEKIIIRFCEKHKIKINEILRACINFTYPLNVKRGTIHRDHNFPHKQILIYLTDSKNGYTYIFNNKNKIIKKIKPEKYKLVCFENVNHAASYPDYKEKRRVLTVFTFV
jgi:hypothetical protein